jgi:type IV secretory pathway VirB10-like protein
MITIPIAKHNEERPTGTMPRYTQFVVTGIIVILVLLATFFSGNKSRKMAEPPSPGGPTPNQLQSFQKALERQRREADKRQSRETDGREQRSPRPRTTEALTPVSGLQASPMTEPFGELIRTRAASAALASNYAVRAAQPTVQSNDPVDLATQVIILTPVPAPSALNGTPTPQVNSEDHGVGGPKSESPGKPKESGRRLPPQEGELFRLYEGTLVQAALANRLDGSFTGPVNSIVSAPVLAKDGKETLIPVGSRFLGKANKVEAENQTRLAVSFKRLILPNGYSVDLEAAPGLDDAGETGLKGKVDNHNMSKFGIAGAVGLLGGLALYAGQANPYAAGVGNSTGSSATSILNHYLNQVPTITVPEGHPVNIYLPADLLLPAYRP